MTYAIQLLASAILFLLFAWVAACNAYFVTQQMRGPSGPSVAPILGGLCGMSAVLLFPIADLADRSLYSWIPLVLDLGCMPFLLGFPWSLRLPNKR